jgi:hypothetical protein
LGSCAFSFFILHLSFLFSASCLNLFDPLETGRGLYCGIPLLRGEHLAAFVYGRGRVQYRPRRVHALRQGRSDRLSPHVFRVLREGRVLHERGEHLFLGRLLNARRRGHVLPGGGRRDRGRCGPGRLHSVLTAGPGDSGYSAHRSGDQGRAGAADSGLRYGVLEDVGWRLVRSCRLGTDIRPDRLSARLRDFLRHFRPKRPSEPAQPGLPYRWFEHAAKCASLSQRGESGSDRDGNASDSQSAPCGKGLSCQFGTLLRGVDVGWYRVEGFLIGRRLRQNVDRCGPDLIGDLQGVLLASLYALAQGQRTEKNLVAGACQLEGRTADRQRDRAGCRLERCHGELLRDGLRVLGGFG